MCKISKKYFILCLFVLFFAKTSIAQQTIVVEDKNTIYKIGKMVTFFEDKESKLSIEQILKENLDAKFTQSNQEIPHFGMTHSSIWVKFIVQNQTKEDIYLEIANPLLEKIELYEVFENNSYKMRTAGILKPFREREIQNNLFLFSLDTLQNKQKQVFYIKVRNQTPIYFPLKITTLKPLVEKNHSIDLFEGAYIGIIFIMVLYNFFIFITVRDKIYLWYVVYVVSVGILVTKESGHFFEFVIKDSYFFNNYKNYVGGLIIFSSTFFSINFLQINTYLPRWGKILYIYLFLAFISCILNLLGMRLESQVLGQFAGMLTFLSLIIIGIVIYFKGFKTARYYIFAWGFLVVGALVHLADLNGAFPSNFYTHYAGQIGSSIEVLLLSFALADRINTYRKEKEEAQQESFEALKENERLVLEQNKILEQKVEERTLELKKSNEELSQVIEELDVTNESLTKLNSEMAKKNEDITASITYAKKIQQVMLPAQSDIERLIPKHFIVYEPRDLVAGDFYWIEQKNDKTFIVVADCTGHGVPGAFMSMIGHELLNQTIINQQIEKPDIILSEMHKSIKKALKQDETHNRDGMDMVVVVWDKNQNTLEYAGAHNPLVITKENEIIEIKGDKYGIGGLELKEKNFTSHLIHLDEYKNSTFYMYSDGYQDQFGGEFGKKFMKKQFKETLLKASTFEIKEQKKYLEDTLNDWKKNQRQTDDILVVGIQI